MAFLSPQRLATWCAVSGKPQADRVSFEEQERLGRALKPGTKAAITGLVGMGDLGKTELAKQAAHCAARRFRDGAIIPR